MIFRLFPVSDDIFRRCQEPSVGHCRRNGARIHQRHRCNLMVLRPDTFPVQEIPRHMADAEISVGRYVPRSNAGAAEGRLEDHALLHQPGGRPVLHQFHENWL